ncbi:MAG: UPF0182 family protein [Clostridiales bacterium]|jgi:uncharacterized membrane protein (UPF0182 family)|nr:UPF0182 family protein [Clostridiales bacterium]
MDVIDMNELNRGKAAGKKLRIFGVAVGILAALVVGALVAKGFYMEVIQLDEIGGLSSVFWINLGYKIAAFAAGCLVSFLALFVTGIFIRRMVRAFWRGRGIEPGKLPVALPAAILGFFGGLLVSNEFYIKALTFLNSTPFGAADPLFSTDIGYYVFERPFLIAIYSFFSGLTVLVFFYTLIYYGAVLLGRDQQSLREIAQDHAIVVHNVVNVALFIAVRIFSYRFTREGLLYSDVVNNAGAGFTDVNVLLRYYTIAPFLLVAVLACGLFFLFRRDLKKALLSFAVYPAVFILTMLVAAAVQFLIVNPNEYNLEKPYIEYNMKYTRQAFGLDQIRSYSFPETRILTPDVVARGRNIIDNVRVVDIDSTVKNNIQLQSNTNFYSFHDGDILNYTVNGKETPVFTSAREVDQNRIPDKSYINTKFKYTHGYGVVMNSINKITPKGQVEYILSGLRMRSTDGALVVDQPRIYYGEITNEQVVVNAAGINEIDYDGNEEFRYDGSGGIPLGFLNRVLFAIENQDLNLLTSNYVKGATLLLNRNVVARAQKAFPFLHVDGDAYIVLTDEGGLAWVMDAFTYSDQYPYAQKTNGVNYIRNSVKIVVDAYNGTTDYYLIDRDDPIIRTYSKIYPGVFRDEPLPESLQKHNRFPEALFNIQADVLRRYHLPESESATFYSQQDLWAIAKKQRELKSDETENMEPYYNLLMLPEGVGEKEELILMLPFTPSGENKNNMVSWLAVRNSYEHYGETIIFEFPKNTNVFGPYQVEVKINQIDKISSDMTLWGQSGSDVYKGNLLVIPIEDSVLYVEPVYIRAAGTSSIPEVREIVVGYQDGDEFIYGIGIDLESALADLFKEAGGEETGAAAAASEGAGAGSAGESDSGAGAGTSVGENAAASGEPPTDEERAAALAELNEKYGELVRQLDDLGALIERLQ